MHDQAARHHVVITGTGRSGTTFLVELLTHLGLDTGFSAAQTSGLKDPVAQAGLERNINDADCPYIIKNPGFCDQAKEVLQRNDIVIDHIYVPMRDLHAAAESRRRVTQENLSREAASTRLKRQWLQLCYGKQSFKETIFDGGTIPGPTPQTKQEEILRDRLYNLLLAASNSEVPVTFMHYPRITKDCSYLYAKLKGLLPGITYEHFRLIFASTVRTDLIHTFNPRDRWDAPPSMDIQEAA
ncbi:MAG: hypothetical protein VKO19_00785 [Cyanobacteriota bacterium]|nr:hypothetical protein [Cyanobacteriota bacterium]